MVNSEHSRFSSPIGKSGPDYSDPREPQIQPPNVPGIAVLVRNLIDGGDD